VCELKNVKRPTIAIQGFGNAGSTLAKLCHEAGLKVVGVSDSKGAAVNMQGLDIPAVIKHKQKTGSVVGFPQTKTVSNQVLLRLECDVLVPSALENQITRTNANRIKAKVVLEVANGPVSLEAREILHNKGVFIIPDILANSGGVTVSYFEWLQNNSGKYWSLEEVKQKLKEKIVKAFKDVHRHAKEHKTDMGTAAFIHAISELNKVLQLEK
jgi:glutamate dehydrogenase/leucine dehydrogenase